MIEFRIEDRVAVITLNHPESRNALSEAMIEALNQALDRVAADPQVRALILCGQPKYFCSGADLKALRSLTEHSKEHSAEANRQAASRLSDLFYRLYRLPIPTIAAIEGVALAGGAGLACCCDLVVASEGAKLGYTEAKLGFVAAIVGVFLLRSVGEKRARELLLTAAPVEAQQALGWGLINRICQPGAALDTSLELARQIAANSPSALRAAKELLAVIPGMGLREALDHAVLLNAWIRHTDDLREGVSAFLEKRSPQW